MGLCVVIVGNIVDGVTILGPFNNSEEANEWADQKLKNEDWIVVALDAPESL